MLFEKNIGKHLSIDEVALTNGELYTIITNKAAHGKQGALVAMVEGTKVSDIAPILKQIPLIFYINYPLRSFLIFSISSSAL